MLSLNPTMSKVLTNCNFILKFFTFKIECLCHKAKMHRWLLCCKAVIMFRKEMQARIGRMLTYSNGNKNLSKIGLVLVRVSCGIELFTFSLLTS